jgi:ABC-type Mn2+/Zn2+ transport system ATPase subunit
VELLSLEQVSIGHRRGEPLLPPFSFTVGRGDIVGVLGPNGAGKSTFLKTMLGLLNPLSGRITYPSGRPPRVGYLPQTARPDFAYPLSVMQVTLMGRYGSVGLINRPTRADRDFAMAQLTAVGLEALAERPFRALSGGQQQRALVARALTTEPELLVLDEPTSEMDPAAQHGLLSLVSALATQRNIGVVFVTHEISAAAGFSKRVVLLDGPAKYFETGPARELVSSERMTKLYGRPVEVRYEDGRALVWLAANEGPPA